MTYLLTSYNLEDDEGKGKWHGTMLDTWSIKRFRMR